MPIEPPPPAKKRRKIPGSYLTAAHILFTICGLLLLLGELGNRRTYPVFPTIELTALGSPAVRTALAGTLDAMGAQMRGLQYSETLTPTVTSTVAPTTTGTPVPTLMAHEWSQSEPLITMDSDWFDGYCGLEEAYPVRFTLFPNGELFDVRWNHGLEADQIQTAQLSRQATCNLLNSIDQAGFFDYDPASYVRDPDRAHWPVMGAPSTQISVKAWRSNSIDLYELGSFVDPVQVEKLRKELEPQCGACPNLDFPTILPALRKTNEMLVQYRPADLHLFEPGRLGVWVVANGDSTKAIEWPLKSRTLASLNISTEFAGKDPSMILTGRDARQMNEAVHQAFDNCGMDVTEGGKVYRILARPLLPNEFNLSPLQKVSLSCSPSDGWVDMP